MNEAEAHAALVAVLQARSRWHCSQLLLLAGNRADVDEIERVLTDLVAVNQQQAVKSLKGLHPVRSILAPRPISAAEWARMQERMRMLRPKWVILERQYAADRAALEQTEGDDDGEY